MSKEIKCKVTFDDGHVEEGIVIDRFNTLGRYDESVPNIVVDFGGESGTYTYQQRYGNWYWVGDASTPHQIEIESERPKVGVIT